MLNIFNNETLLGSLIISMSLTSLSVIGSGKIFLVISGNSMKVFLDVRNQTAQQHRLEYQAFP